MREGQVFSVTAWLGGPPLLAAPFDLLDALVGDVRTVVEPYGGNEVSTNEPRTYGPGVRGHAQLAGALASRRVQHLSISSPPLSPFGPWRPKGGYAQVDVILGFKEHPNWASSVGLTIVPKAGSDYPDVAGQLVGFVMRWFGLLHSSSAFVSIDAGPGADDGGDQPHVTAYERAHGGGTLVSAAQLRQFARGVFWGNGLGDDLCARLGGDKRVLREAPALHRRPLPGGVWLQLSDFPPAEASSLSRLADFLSPLLNWTPEDLQRANANDLHSPPVWPNSRPEQPARSIPAVATPARPADRRAVPLRWLVNPEGTAVALNIYLNSPPDPSQVVALEDAVQDWYAAGFDGAYGRPGFHDLEGPTVDVRVVRWYVDLGSAHGRSAIRALARRLGDLVSPLVMRIVVGTERVN